jgi:accessory colonization factor AcfC
MREWWPGVPLLLACALALERWRDDPSVHARLNGNIRATAHPGVADFVPPESRYRLYRDCGAGLATRGRASAVARAFAAFQRGVRGQAIFAHRGWKQQHLAP